MCQLEVLGLTGLREVGEGDADQKLLQYWPGEWVKKKKKKKKNTAGMRNELGPVET